LATKQKTSENEINIYTGANDAEINGPDPILMSIKERIDAGSPL
jgi:hypothetical protein